MVKESDEISAHKFVSKNLKQRVVFSYIDENSEKTVIPGHKINVIGPNDFYNLENFIGMSVRLQIMKKN